MGVERKKRRHFLLSRIKEKRRHCVMCKIFIEVVVRFSFVVAASVVCKRKRYDFLSGTYIPMPIT